MDTGVEFLIIGGGIAGASAAYELAANARVMILERESQPGYHSTGRSAAVFTEIYGNVVIRALTVASADFFLDPPQGFSDHPLLSPRPLIMIGRHDQRGRVEQLHEVAVQLVPNLRIIEREEVLKLSPILRADYVACGLLEPNSSDMDVHAIHSGFLRGARARGAQIVSNAEVRDLQRSREGWVVDTSAGKFVARHVVNAAGAWADALAELAGVRPIGLVPKRRTAFTFSFDPAAAVDPWPTVIDVSEQFYFKPEGGKLLGSPADETPSPPCDAQPEELDIAIAIDRISAAVNFDVKTVDSRWAGLRSFVHDKTPVVGFDDDAEGFFWLAAQGGYGIQTSAAMGRLAAALAFGKNVPADLSALGISADLLSPSRLRPAHDQQKTRSIN
ncbi:FAD-dependent oxidoreductase [Aquibium oceanicum]|uniref:FAD-dependent oxidoreductase n=1 Tax=Aquibium oceanicum TaxID=1670800 RepID=A0A1L3SPL0_9HYPH|nr:FAD-dependent oxidoreductase [Aquibium oceanicum]